MPTNLKFRLVLGFNFGQRSIGFLEGDDELDAAMIFDSLEGSPCRLLRSRIDHWLEGNIFDRYFHGWHNPPKYKSCFVFKWEERRIGHRLYGFLCNPMPNSNPRFQSCVLILHDRKKEWETDTANLERVIRWQGDLRTKAAIAEVYPEYGEVTRWKN